MGLGPWSHGSYLFIIGPMGTFVFFALGCLEGEAQTTNMLWIGKSADSLGPVKKSGVFASPGVVNMKYYHVVFGLFFPLLKTDQCAAEIELNRRLQRLVHCCWLNFVSPLLFAVSLSLRLPPWTQAEPPPYCRGFMIYVSWSVTPNRRWLAEWRRVVSNTRQTIQIRSWTLELIANIQRESGQSVSLRLFKSVSLSLFLSFRLMAIKLGSEFPSTARQKETLQEPACLCCYSDVSLQTIASHDGCFYEFERREPGHRLTHSSPA